MRAVVVYESIYGNTRAVAEAIAAGLAEHADVVVFPVAEADAQALAGARLLVVGGPTHMHGLPTSFSRRMSVKAAEEDDLVAPRIVGSGIVLCGWRCRTCGRHLRPYRRGGG